jgi:hypothetical protein
VTLNGDAVSRDRHPVSVFDRTAAGRRWAFPVLRRAFSVARHTHAVSRCAIPVSRRTAAAQRHGMLAHGSTAPPAGTP